MPSNLLPTQASSVEKKSPQNYPDLTTWCEYLDLHADRNQDSIVFVPLGAMLKQKGFVRITQLTSVYVDVSSLQNWLGIEVGTAILIMQYAKADVMAINAGRLFFPHRSSGFM